tara:strand:+ start:42 stop:149 length:108 start_codon:yes stop_codon:yes gene_type:complete
VVQLVTTDQEVLVLEDIEHLFQVEPNYDLQQVLSQ